MASCTAASVSVVRRLRGGGRGFQRVVGLARVAVGVDGDLLQQFVGALPAATDRQRALQQRHDLLGTVSARSAYTRERESSAAITSNDGFSVVAPIRMMSPRST
jgi:hypothetical protein